MSEDSVRAARDALVDAGAALSRRANRDVVAALARVVDGFADPGSEWRRALARDLPEATGFHPETVQRGLAVGSDAWAGTDLARLASRQRLGEDRLDDATPEWTSGFASTSVLLAGAIPMPTLLALVFPLALRSPVLVRASAADPVTPECVQASLAETDPELGAAVRIVRFDSANDEAWRTWFEAPCLVATGSDATVKALAGRAEPWQRFVGYGHRESFAALGPDALDGPALTACIDSVIRCETCQWANLLTGAGVDCDLFDNAVVDTSCQ